MKAGKSILILICLLLVAGIAAYAYSVRWTPDLSGPSGSIAVDSEGRFYMLNNTQTHVNLFRINQRSTLDYLYTNPINSPDRLLLYQGVFIDELRNSLYTIQDVLDNNTNQFVASNLVAFDLSSKGGGSQTLLSMDLTDASGDGWFIKHISPGEEALYLAVANEEMDRAGLLRLPLETTGPLTLQPDLLLDFSLPDQSLIYQVLGNETELIVQTLDGAIYQVLSSGAPRLLFPRSEQEDRAFPFSLNLDEDNLLHFYEIHSRKINTLDLNQSSEGIEPPEPLAGFASQLFPGSPYTQEDLLDFTVLNQQVQAYLVKADSDGEAPLPFIRVGSESWTLSSLKLDNQLVRQLALKNGFYLFSALLALFLTGKLLHYIFYLRPSLLAKFVSFVIPVVLVAMLLFSLFAYNIYNESLARERNALVVNVGSFVVPSVDLGLLSQINRPANRDSLAHEELLDAISGSASPYRLYCVLMKVEDQRIYTAVSADMPTFVPLEALYSQDSMALYQQVLKAGTPVNGTIHDMQGSWTVSLLPIRDEAGKIVGILESGINSKDLEASSLRLFRYMLGIGLTAAAATLLAIFLAVKYLLGPLKLLKDAVIQVYNGQYGAQAAIKASDEISDIGRAFNRLSLELRSQFNQLTALNDAYYKFVPPDTFTLLNKSSILEVSLGDQSRIQLTLLHTTIRNFESLTANLSQEAIFQLINRIFKIVSSNTTNASGLIHSYQVNRVTGLFQQHPEKALQAVINIRSDLMGEVDAGFSIHTAPCLYGIVGVPNRFSPAVVSENNDLLYALEGLLHTLACSILVTGPTYEALASPQKYHHRFLGYGEDSRSQAMIPLYEFFDGDPHGILNGKKLTLDAFRQAVSDYLERDFYKARNQFAQIVKINPGDTVARWFLFQCDALCKQPEERTASLSLCRY